MFDIEQSTAKWRRQMVAAGIKSPSVLDELESHLREDVSQQMRCGLEAHEPFEWASSRIGQGSVLKTEFAKARGFWRFLGENKAVKTNRILGVLWLTGCSLSLNTVCRQFVPSQPTGTSPDTTLLWMTMMAGCIYLAGMIGSVFLFRGAKWGRSIVRMLALLMMIVCIAQASNFRMRVWCGIVAVFSLASVWLLHPPVDTNSNPTPAPQ